MELMIVLGSEFLVMSTTRIWNLKCLKCSVNLLTRSPNMILRLVVASQIITIESLGYFLKQKIVIRLCSNKSTSKSQMRRRWVERVVENF